MDHDHPLPSPFASQPEAFFTALMLPIVLMLLFVYGSAETSARAAVR